MDKNALGISILGGEIKAAAFRRGSVEVVDCPDTGENLAGLEKVLVEAAQKARAQGQPVAVALSHLRLVDQIVEVPPVKGWKLTRVLQRRAQTVKAFAGEAVWSRQAA